MSGDQQPRVEPVTINYARRFTPEITFPPEIRWTLIVWAISFCIYEIDWMVNFTFSMPGQSIHQLLDPAKLLGALAVLVAVILPIASQATRSRVMSYGSLAVVVASLIEVLISINNRPPGPPSIEFLKILLQVNAYRLLIATPAIIGFVIWLRQFKEQRLIAREAELNAKEN